MKNVKLNFSKPLRIIKEGQMYKPSIVAIGKSPWEQKANNKITSYKYLIYINLWLLEIEFDFIKKVKDASNKRS